MFLHPVHYQEPDGQWHEFRPEIQARLPGETFAFGSAFVPYQAGFTNRPDDNTVEFRYQSSAVRFSSQDRSGKGPFTATRTGKTLSYRRADGNVEYRYTLGNTTLKETIVLHKPTTQHEYAFKLELADAVPAQEPDGSISALGTQGAILWRIAAPTAVDAAGHPAPEVTQRLEDRGGETDLIVSVDPDWLTHPERQWPVEIDPTIVLDPDPAAGMDTTATIVKHYHGSYSSGNGAGSSSTTYVGSPFSANLTVGKSRSGGCTSSGWDEWKYTNVSLLKFDLSGLPTAGTVNYAQLNLYGTGGTADLTLEVKPVGASWEELSTTYQKPRVRPSGP